MMSGNQIEQLNDREKFHWYQNAQNLFWKSPIWEVQTKFDTEFNKKLLDEIYSIGYGISTGQDKKPKDSIWDYDKPNLNIIKQEIIDIVTKTITQQIPEIRMLNLKGCEHFFGWVNVHEPGEGLEVHGHTESAIAATYYIQAPEGCGELVLFDSSNAIDWKNTTLTGTPVVKERRIKPIEGKLVFTPSYVLHGVTENKSNDLRISLSTDLRKVVDKNTNNTVILKSWASRMKKIKEWKCSQS
jgi:hypothetical protein